MIHKNAPKSIRAFGDIKFIRDYFPLQSAHRTEQVAVPMVVQQFVESVAEQAAGLVAVQAVVSAAVQAAGSVAEQAVGSVAA